MSSWSVSSGLPRLAMVGLERAVRTPNQTKRAWQQQVRSTQAASTPHLFAAMPFHHHAGGSTYATNPGRAIHGTNFVRVCASAPRAKRAAKSDRGNLISGRNIILPRCFAKLCLWLWPDRAENNHIAQSAVPANTRFLRHTGRILGSVWLVCHRQWACCPMKARMPEIRAPQAAITARLSSGSMMTPAMLI